MQCAVLGHASSEGHESRSCLGQCRKPLNVLEEDAEAAYFCCCLDSKLDTLDQVILLTRGLHTSLITQDQRTNIVNSFHTARPRFSHRRAMLVKKAVTGTLET